MAGVNEGLRLGIMIDGRLLQALFVMAEAQPKELNTAGLMMQGIFVIDTVLRALTKGFTLLDNDSAMIGLTLTPFRHKKGTVGNDNELKQAF